MPQNVRLDAPRRAVRAMASERAVARVAVRGSVPAGLEVLALIDPDAPRQTGVEVVVAPAGTGAVIEVVFNPAGERLPRGTYPVHLAVGTGTGGDTARAAGTVRFVVGNPCLRFEPKTSVVWNLTDGTATLGVSLWSCGDVDLSVDLTATYDGRRVTVSPPTATVGAAAGPVELTLELAVVDGRLDPTLEAALEITAESEATTVTARPRSTYATPTTADPSPRARPAPPAAPSPPGGAGWLRGVLAVVAVLVVLAALAAARRWGGVDSASAGPKSTAVSTTDPEPRAPGITAPADTAAVDTVPDDTVPDDTAPDDTAPNDTAPDDTTPDDTVPDDTVPDDGVSEDTGPDPVPAAELVVTDGSDRAITATVGRKGRASFSITNTGDADADVGATLAPEVTGFRLEGGSCGGPLAPGSDCTVLVVFEPGTAGDHRATVVVEDRSTGLTLDLQVTATAAAAADGDLRVTIADDPQRFEGCPGGAGECVAFTVDNRGPGSTPAVAVAVTAGGRSVRVQAPPLAAAQRAALLAPIEVPCDPDCGFEVTVDPDGVVRETDETNNTDAWFRLG